MEWHNRWLKAKKDSAKKFQTAYKNWCNKLEAEIKNSNPEAKLAARAKVLQERLKVSGLEPDQGSSFTSFMKFDSGLGPALDKLEKAVALVPGKTYKRKQVEDTLRMRVAVAKTMTAYDREAKAYAKRWSKMEPDFWSDIQNGLLDIAQKIDNNPNVQRLERWKKNTGLEFTFK